MKPEAVFDEGLVVTEGMMPGIEPPVALIGIAEKGYLSLALSAAAEGGHSSMPPTSGTAIGTLATAVQRLGEEPPPAQLEGPAAELFGFVAPEMAFFPRFYFANLWAFEPVILAQLERTASTNALVRTTQAPTMLSAGVKDNVLPTRAQAVVNFRIRPGETRDTVIDHVRRVTADLGIEVEPLPGGIASDPSAVSSVDSRAFAALHRAVLQTFPGAIVAPSVFVAATDSRHWGGVAQDVYRFSPQRMGPGDRPRFHGTDERLSVKNYGEAVRFYAQLMRNVAGPQPMPNIAEAQ